MKHMFKKNTEIPNSFFRLVWYFFKPFKWMFTLHTALTIIITTFWGSYFQLAIRHLLEMIENSPLTGVDMVKQVIPFLLFVVGITAFFLGLQYLQSVNYRAFRPKFHHFTKMTLLEYVNEHSYSFFLNNHIGSLAGRIEELSQATHNFLKNIVCRYAANLISTIFALAIFFYIQPLFGMILTALAVVYIVISLMFFRRKREWEKEKAGKKQRVSEEIHDTFSNFVVVKSFSCSNTLLNRISARIKDYCDCWRRQYMFDVRFTLSIETLQYGIVFLITFIALSMYAMGNIALADFVYVTSSIFPLIHKIHGSVQDASDFIQELGISDQAIETLLVPHTVTDKSKAIKLQNVRGKIDFQHVSFAYKNKKIFSDFNLTIKPNEKVGLVGISGAGKTTMSNLLLRFFDVDAGAILVDGFDVRDVKQNSLRDNIAYVPQDITLFNRTIADNLSFAKKKCTLKEIKHICHLTGLDKIIEQMPQQYDTIVGERGMKLSGGQRQKVAIARALLANKKILVMDEATASMDSLSEQELQRNIELLTKNKTCLIIAHRLSTLKQMDRIVVMHKGKIAEQGTHKQLMKNNKLYAKLYRTQNQMD